MQIKIPLQHTSQKLEEKVPQMNPIILQCICTFWELLAVTKIFRRVSFKEGRVGRNYKVGLESTIQVISIFIETIDCGVLGWSYGFLKLLLLLH